LSALSHSYFSSYSAATTMTTISPKAKVVRDLLYKIKTHPDYVRLSGGIRYVLAIPDTMMPYEQLNVDLLDGIWLHLSTGTPLPPSLLPVPETAP